MVRSNKQILFIRFLFVLKSFFVTATLLAVFVPTGFLSDDLVFAQTPPSGTAQRGQQRGAPSGSPREDGPVLAIPQSAPKPAGAPSTVQVMGLRPSNGQSVRRVDPSPTLNLKDLNCFSEVRKILEPDKLGSEVIGKYPSRSGTKKICRIGYTCRKDKTDTWIFSETAHCWAKKRATGNGENCDLTYQECRGKELRILMPGEESIDGMEAQPAGGSEIPSGGGSAR